MSPQDAEAWASRIRAAYADAWGRVQAHGAEALEALNKAEIFPEDSTARELFERKAKRALDAAEAWQGSVRLCLKTMSELDQHR
jgi:hypothetical protein